jgi:hypothetical protein
MLRKYVSLAFILVFTLAFALPILADIPPPPLNQTIGIPDGIFNNLDEAECRFCHEDPDIVSGDANIPNRHHNLVNSAIQTGECSLNSNACLSDADCVSNICSRSTLPQVTCVVDEDCPLFEFGETCGETCLGETVAPDIDSDQNGTSDTIYQCLNCHIEDTTGGIITLIVFRDCLVCHVQVPGESSVHHLTPTAQGTDSPIGDPNVGDCTPCHGTLVDDTGDGHAIPTYDPSLVTPSTRNGDGLPLNDRGNGAGACNYCHDQDTIPPADPVFIFENEDTHHNAGVHKDETGFSDQLKCSWCHGDVPLVLDIRTCENCHGFESLHNIAIDSDTGCLFGDPGCEVLIGGETAGYSHVGNDDDCWGCHGFLQASAPGSGPITPYIVGTDVLAMATGTDTAVTLTGSALTNLVGTFQWTSDVTMTAADGSSVTLTPDSITSNQLTVTVSGTTTPGNYAFRAVKGTYAESNPVVIAVLPEVGITDVNCDKKKGVLSVNGSGFGEKPAGTDDYINVEVNGQLVDILTWSDTQIKAFVSSCRKNVSISVNALMGSATSGGNGGGKPDKPCKGKGCNK